MELRQAELDADARDVTKGLDAPDRLDGRDETPLDARPQHRVRELLPREATFDSKFLEKMARRQISNTGHALILPILSLSVNHLSWAARACPEIPLTVPIMPPFSGAERRRRAVAARYYASLSTAELAGKMTVLGKPVSEKTVRNREGGSLRDWDAGELHILAAACGLPYAFFEADLSRLDEIVPATADERVAAIARMEALRKRAHPEEGPEEERPSGAHGRGG